MMRFSTESFPAADRFDAFRETLARKVVRVDVMAADVAGFHADVSSQPLPNVRLSVHRLAPCSLMRTPATVRDGDDSVTLLALIKGRVEVMVGDYASVLTGGQAILLNAHQVGGVRVAQGSPGYTLSMERHVARRRMPSLDRCAPRPTPVGDPAFAILRSYCRQLMAMPALSGPTAELVDAQLQELIVNMVAQGDAADSAEGAAPAARAVRLHMIKTDIAENLSLADLSIAAVAARHRLTVRYVQRLFEEDGITFTEFVLGERLAQVHWLLTNSRDTALKISAVALEAGFGNLSHFNASFRRRYGATPSDVRAQAGAMRAMRRGT